MRLPLVVEELGPEWLTAALSERFPGVRVTSIDVVEILWGTATKIRIRPRYAPGSDAGLPDALCIKGGFREELRAVVGDAYCLEAEFFRHIAPTLGVPLPACWYAGSDRASKQGIVVLDDLVDAGVRFGDPVEPWSVDLVAEALDLQAGWHARTWGATREQFPWLPVGTPIRVPADFLTQPAHWSRMLDVPDAQPMPAAFRDRERIRRAIFEMWRLDDTEGVPCLAHADAHIGNTYVDPKGHPRFIDWQGACLAPALDDVSYFVTGALTVEDRRAHEQSLLRYYLDRLVAEGGPKLAFDEAWLDYRRHTVHGFLWVLTPPEMQAPVRVRAMGDRYVAALEDHETLKLLGV
ncbi:MAG TPA: phosphotransferase [Nevskiaceae bacterium]|nr:phosphotransferase [Nevskiaceae bacterium]